MLRVLLLLTVLHADVQALPQLDAALRRQVADRLIAPEGVSSNRSDHASVSDRSPGVLDDEHHVFIREGIALKRGFEDSFGSTVCSRRPTRLRKSDFLNSLNPDCAENSDVHRLVSFDLKPRTPQAGGPEVSQVMGIHREGIATNFFPVELRLRGDCGRFALGGFRLSGAGVIELWQQVEADHGVQQNETAKESDQKSGYEVRFVLRHAMSARLRPAILRPLPLEVKGAVA